MFQKPSTSERSSSHAKYQFPGVLTPSSPVRSLVMLSWICLQVFSLCFFLLDCPGWSRSCGVYAIFFCKQVLLRTARQEERGKIGQILSVPWRWLKKSLPGSSPCPAKAEPSAGKGEEYSSVMDHHHVCHLSSVSHYLCVQWMSPTFNLTHVY